jgi:hypothetical protein
MQIINESDIAKADALVQLRKAVDNGVGEEVRVPLATALDLTNPDWKQREDFIDRIKAVGPRQAAEGLLRTYGV